jgi:hypothetical protein
VNDADVLCFAARYAHYSASWWEDGNGCPEGYLPHCIVDVARLASIPLSETGIDRRERLAAAERNRQGRAGTHRLRG